MSNSDCRTAVRFRMIAVGLAAFASWNLMTAQGNGTPALTPDASSLLQHASGPIRLASLLFDRPLEASTRLVSYVSSDAETNSVRLAVHEQWEAFRLKDETRMRAITDDAFSSSADASKESLLSWCLAPTLVVKSADADYRHAQVTLVGDQAVVSYSAEYVVSDHGATEHVDNQSTDIFIKRDGSWRIIGGSAQETRTPIRPY